MRRGLKIWIFVIFILVVLWSVPRLAVFLTDLAWFQEVGYSGVFWQSFRANILTAVVAGLVFFAILFGNALLAIRLAPRAPWHDFERRSRLQLAYELERYVDRMLVPGALIISLFAGYVAGAQASPRWFSILMALHPSAFGKQDPLFHRDLSFYIFQLPVQEMIQNYLAAAIVLAIILSAVVHYFARAIRTIRGVPAFAPHVKIHLSLLLAGWFLVKAWDYRLQAYELLFSSRGVVFGATYADVHARLFACYALIIIAILCAIAVTISIRSRGFALPVGAVIILVIASVLGGIYPAAVQRFKVQPSEQTLEEPFIARNIEATRFGFNLHTIKTSSFPALKTYTADTLQVESSTIQNVRLWDHRPLLEVYRQKQQFQPYYQFNDVDIDRYMINDEYRQVMLSGREIDLNRLPDQRWQNQHIAYTHGYGTVLSPVNEVIGEGDPQLHIRNIPPISEGLQKVTRPGIYFGEMAAWQHYSLVRTNLQENDYPLTAQETAKTTYNGKGGISLRSSLMRLAMSIRFGDINLLLSNDITKDTRMIFRRSIYDRVSAIAPFLAYDADPYLVISKSGKLYWIQDGYTMSHRLPYSQPYPHRSSYRVNYIRNAAKVVIDAYDGTTTFFVADPDDPIITTLQKVFPNLFVPMDQLPEDLDQHIRYPEEQFNLQARVNTIYHMTDPQIFYRKIDRWEIARERGGKQTRVQQEFMPEESTEGEQMQAYYALMRLPGEQKPEFILMIPFTPLNRPNMVAWMAARCDPEHYGELIVYEFPRVEQVYGPIQIEASIDQHGDISRLLSLWGQRGSQVVRGNLLVIPLGHAVLYVEPIFLKADVAAIPQLKLVVVGRQEGGTLRVFFGPTLERALAIAVGQAPAMSVEELLRAETTATPPPTRTPAVAPQRRTTPPPAATGQPANRALEQYRRAQERLKDGDLAGFQRELDRLEEILKEMANRK